MKFSKLIDVAKGRGVSVGEMDVGSDPEILGVAEDSRKVKAGDLFVARGGSKTSGVKFVADAVGRGAVAVVSEGEWSAVSGQWSEGVAFARVVDANLAAAVLAHEMAGNPTSTGAGMKVIGITGTKGKTTVAYLLRSVLKAAGMKVGMIGTVEIDDGKDVVPADMTTPGAVELVEMFSRMKANGVTHCVMEVSSHALHQHRVAGIDFAVGIFTNLTGDHLDYHKTMEEYAAAKAMLFEGLKEGAVAIINFDDPWAERMTRGCKGRIVPYRVTDRPKMGPGVIFPIELPAIPGDPTKGPRNIPTYPDVVPHGGFASYIWRMNSYGMGIGIGIDATALGQDCTGQTIVTPLVGRHNCYNITSVFAASTLLGVLRQPRDIKSRVELMTVWRKSTGAPGRLQRVAGDVAFTVFVDYAHTHDAMENVLSALRTTMGNSTGHKSAADVGIGLRVPSAEHAQGPFPEHGTRGDDVSGRLICVFGCGGDRDRTKRPKMGAVAERLADVVIVTSDNPRTEEPGAILQEICAGFSSGWKEAGKIRVEPNRRAAIRLAIGEARKGDVVLIAGKGHENYQIVGTVKHHFDDVEEAEAALREIVLNYQDTKAPS